MPFLSVIVPVYGVEKFLVQCLDSILSQTFTDYEVILVEDGSPDRCAAICDDFAVRDSRVSVLHKTNEGLVRARKDGLKLATGSYVGFVDGDDWVEPDMFEKLCEAARELDADIVNCGFFAEYPDRRVVVGSVVAPGVYDKALMQRDVFPVMLTTRRFGEYGILPAVWCKIFRKGLLDDNLPAVPDRIRNGEDGAITYPCLLDAARVCLLPDPLYHYRQHPAQMVRQFDVRHLESLGLWVNYVRGDALRHGSQVLRDQIAYYVQYKVTLLLEAALGQSADKMRGVWTVLRSVACDPLLPKLLAEKNLGALSSEARVSFAIMDSPAWPLVMALYPLVRAARVWIGNARRTRLFSGKRR